MLHELCIPVNEQGTFQQHGISTLLLPFTALCGRAWRNCHLGQMNDTCFNYAGVANLPFCRPISPLNITKTRVRIIVGDEQNKIWLHGVSAHKKHQKMYLYRCSSNCKIVSRWIAHRERKHSNHKIWRWDGAPRQLSHYLGHRYSRLFGVYFNPQSLLPPSGAISRTILGRHHTTLLRLSRTKREWA